MSLKSKFILVIIWLLTILIAFNIGKISVTFDNSFHHVSSDVLHSSDRKSHILIKRYAWGLTGNHQIIYLTDNEEREYPNKIEDIVFEKSGTIFYQTTNDTVNIYSRVKLSQMHIRFKDFTIITHQLNNPQFMELFDKVHNSLNCTDWMK